MAFGVGLAVQGHTILLEGKESYFLMGFDRYHGLMLRAAALTIAALVSLCFFAAASRPVAWSGQGRHTRSVFLLHGFFTIAAVELLVKEPDMGAHLVGVILICVVGLIALLSQPVFARMIDRMLDGILGRSGAHRSSPIEPATSSDPQS